MLSQRFVDAVVASRFYACEALFASTFLSRWSRSKVNPSLLKKERDTSRQIMFHTQQTSKAITAQIWSAIELDPAAAAMGLYLPIDILGRPYAIQLAHQLSAQAASHEVLQRQMTLERERFLRNPSAAQLHPSLIAQHEEYLRQQQREREMRVRALEEAARGSRL